MTDLSAYRSEFPITESYIYFNHASVSPLPRRVAAAMQNHTTDVLRNAAVNFSKWTEAYQGVRQAAARLIGAAAEEIAITKNTSAGLAVVANGLDWRPGDVVVGIDDEFPANYFPWLRLQGRGVKIRWLKLQKGRIELEVIDRACQGARLLALSYVQYLSGFRIDLDAVGEICRRRDCLLVVDAVQGLGPFPVDVKASGIHALSASAHKWLLGPEGIGMLFVARELIPQVEPVEFGWTNVEGWRSYSHDPTLRQGAARYECGTLNTVGCFGFREALELLIEAGVARMSEQVDRLASQIADGARRKGYELMAERAPGSGSGIVSIRKPGVKATDTVEALNQKGVATASRFGWIRASPHFYATEQEVQQFVDLLP